MLHAPTASMLRCMQLRGAAVLSLSPLWLIAALQAPASCTGDPTGTGGASGGAGMPARTACKRGVAYGFDPAGAVSDLRALSPSVSWFYNWSSRPPAQLVGEYERLGVEFVPMLWNASFNVDDVVNRIPAGAKYLLGFNEPNFHSQANLTPEQAAAAWPRVEEVARRRGLTLVSPAVNYCGGGCNATDPARRRKAASRRRLRAAPQCALPGRAPAVLPGVAPHRRVSSRVRTVPRRWRNDGGSAIRLGHGPRLTVPLPPRQCRNGRPAAAKRAARVHGVPASVADWNGFDQNAARRRHVGGHGLCLVERLQRKRRKALLVAHAAERTTAVAKPVVRRLFDDDAGCAHRVRRGLRVDDGSVAPE